MALNEIALKLRKRYEHDLLSTPIWAEFETARNKLARSVAAPPAQPAREPVARLCPRCSIDWAKNPTSTAPAAQPQQEPVGYLVDGVYFYLVQQFRRDDGTPIPNQVPVYLAPPAQPDSLAQQYAKLAQHCTMLEGKLAAQPQPDALLESSIEPRPLAYPLSDYHKAMSEGPLHYTWQDKPHRLVYDLIAAVKYYRTEPAQPAREPLDENDQIEIMERLGITVAGPASEAVQALIVEVERMHGIGADE